MDIIERHSAKEHAKAVKENKPKRKNNKPEEDVKSDHVRWYKDNGFFVNVYESKAKNIRGRWQSSGLDYGTPDMLGVCNNGYFHSVELKAPGRRSTVRENQHKFLTKAINCGGFAIVSDSLDYTKRVYSAWLLLSAKDRIKLLKSELPKAPQ